MRRCAVALIVATGLLSGCGDAARNPPETATAFYDAIARNDGQAACALASDRYAGQLAYDNPSCEAFFDEPGVGFGGIAEGFEVVGVDENQGGTLVTVRAPESRLLTCLVDVDGEWKVDEIASTENQAVRGLRKLCGGVHSETGRPCPESLISGVKRLTHTACSAAT